MTIRRLSTTKKCIKVLNMDTKIEVKDNATYSINEAQSVLGLKRIAIYERVKRNELKGSLLGNKYRFFGKDLIDYLKSRQG